MVEARVEKEASEMTGYSSEADVGKETEEMVGKKLASLSQYTSHGATHASAVPAAKEASGEDSQC